MGAPNLLLASRAMHLTSFPLCGVPAFYSLLPNVTSQLTKTWRHALCKCLSVSLRSASFWYVKALPNFLFRYCHIGKKGKLFCNIVAQSNSSGISKCIYSSIAIQFGFYILKIVHLEQGCATGGPRATTRPAKPFSVALANTLIFPHHAWNPIPTVYVKKLNFSCGPAWCLKLVIWPTDKKSCTPLI